MEPEFLIQGFSCSSSPYSSVALCILCFEMLALQLDSNMDCWLDPLPFLLRVCVTVHLFFPDLEPSWPATAGTRGERFTKGGQPWELYSWHWWGYTQWRRDLFGWEPQRWSSSASFLFSSVRIYHDRRTCLSTAPPTCAAATIFCYMTPFSLPSVCMFVCQHYNSFNWCSALCRSKEQNWKWVADVIHCQGDRGVGRCMSPASLLQPTKMQFCTMNLPFLFIHVSHTFSKFQCLVKHFVYRRWISQAGGRTLWRDRLGK